MTKIIGLTGGIGSGKSTIAKHIEKLGVPIYIADLEAKKILETEPILTKIRNSFGEKVFENGNIDRKKLSKEVFQHPEKLKILNEIIHPEVALHFKNWLENNKQHQLVIKEAAILFESGSYKDCDQIILVTAPKDIRIQRVIDRDKSTKEEVENRINNQWSEEKKIELSDYVIYNLNLEEAYKAAENIISLLRNQ